MINLKTQFGDRFKVGYEESYHADRGDGARAEDPALLEIRCQYGAIYPWEGSTLAASVDGHPVVAERIRKLNCCRIHQDGDSGELTALFGLANFDQVAEIMHPRRRRRLAGERLAKYQYQSAVEVQSTAPGPPIGA